MATRLARRLGLKVLVGFMGLGGVALLCGFGAATATAAAATSQTISFTSTAPSNASVGGPAYIVTATASSGLAVELSIDAGSTSVCEMSGSTSGSTVSFKAVGTCMVDANQAGNTEYEAATQVQQTFAVKNGQSISFTSTAPSSAMVGASPYTVAATASSGLQVSFSADFLSNSVCSISGSTVSFIGAGTCVIDAYQPGNAEYWQAALAQQEFTVVRSPEKSGQANESTSGSTFTFPIPMSELFAGQTGRQEQSVSPEVGVVRVISMKPNKRSGGETLVVRVSGPGVVSAREVSSARAKHRKHKGTSVLIKPIRVTVGEAGNVTLHISPTKAGATDLKRKHKVPVKVLITFTPTGGAPGTTVKTVVLGTVRR